MATHKKKNYGEKKKEENTNKISCIILEIK